MEHATDYGPVQRLVLGAPISHRPRGHWRVLAVLIGAAGLLVGSALAAYGSRDPSAARRDISGTYAVSTVAGGGLPATVVDTGLASPLGGPAAHLVIVVTGGTVRLTPEGTYTADLSYTMTLDGDTQAVRLPAETGSYRVAGPTLTFLSARGEVVTRGTLANGSLTVPGTLLGSAAIRRWCADDACTARPPRNLFF